MHAHYSRRQRARSQGPPRTVVPGDPGAEVDKPAPQGPLCDFEMRRERSLFAEGPAQGGRPERLEGARVELVG